LFRKILVGLTCRQYAACAEAVPTAFGLSASSVSRRFIRASARHVQTFCERRLDRDEFVALVLDGKTFAQDTNGSLRKQYGRDGRIQLRFQHELTILFSRTKLEFPCQLDHVD
jgi:hypothetical protein